MFVQFAAVSVTYFHTGRNCLLLRCFPTKFQKCHFIPGLLLFFFFPSQLNFLFLFTPATEVWVEIMENTLLSLLTS